MKLRRGGTSLKCSSSLFKFIKPFFSSLTPKPSVYSYQNGFGSISCDVLFLGELTGELPPEIPLDPGEPVPTIRKRVGTEFALSEALLQRMKSSPEEELLAKLELEFEIQSKITSAGTIKLCQEPAMFPAISENFLLQLSFQLVKLDNFFHFIIFPALKISNDTSAPKSVRKQRKLSYQQSLKKLQDIEARLNNLKHLQSKQRRKLPRVDQQVCWLKSNYIRSPFCRVRCYTPSSSQLG